MACVICGYYAQFRAKGLLRECPSVPVNSTHLNRLKSLHHPANPAVLLKEPFRIHTAVFDENRPYTSVAGCTFTPTQPIKIPSLLPGMQPPLGAGSQPEQAWGEPFGSAVEFEDEFSAMGFDGLGFDSVFGEF